jgi:hypothetical protein
MKASSTLLPFALAAALGGCGATPLEYHPASEIPPGPGMLSGADGGLMYRAKQAGEPAAPAAKPVAPSLSAEEYREFQEWREWRRAREEAMKK